MEPVVYWLGLVALVIGPLLVRAAARSRGVRLGWPAFLGYATASGLFLAEVAAGIREDGVFAFLLAALVVVPLLVVGGARLRGFDGLGSAGLGLCAAFAVFAASVGLVAVGYDGYIEDAGSPPTQSLGVGILHLAVAAGVVAAVAVKFLRGPAR